MANKTIEMSKIRQIFRMYAQGTDKKQISSVTSIARNTIKVWIKGNKYAGTRTRQNALPAPYPEGDTDGQDQLHSHNAEQSLPVFY